MKKISTLLFITCIFSSYSFSQLDTLAKWTFPTGTEIDSFPDLASTLNEDMLIFTEGGTGDLDFSKNGETTKAAQADGWDAGNETKSWQIKFNTTGYENLFLSSKQTAGGNNPGPRDFKVQYKIGDAGTWTDVTNSSVTVANDWTTGVLEDVALPSECNNQALVYIRWIMTSDFDINGDLLVSNGRGKIDDIIVVADVVAAVNDMPESYQIDIYPIPATEVLNVISKNTIKNVKIINLTGQIVYQNIIEENNFVIEIATLEKGLYLINMETGNSKNYIEKIIIK